MSSQIIPLKGRTVFQGFSRILATETIRVLSCGAEEMQLGPSLLPGAKLRFGDRRSIESRKAMPAGVTGGRYSLSGDGLPTALIAFLLRGRC